MIYIRQILISLAFVFYIAVCLSIGLGASTLTGLFATWMVLMLVIFGLTYVLFWYARN